MSSSAKGFTAGLCPLRVGRADGGPGKRWDTGNRTRAPLQHPPLPCAVMTRLTWLPRHPGRRGKQVADVNTPWKFTRVYRIPRIISWVENKPKLSIKTMLTQKNAFILEAGDLRRNCPIAPRPLLHGAWLEEAPSSPARVSLRWQKPSVLPDADLAATSYFKRN